jgi:uncharacterized protein YkwD
MRGLTLLASLVVVNAARVSVDSGSVNDKEWEHFNLLNNLRRKGYTCPTGKSNPANSRNLIFDCPLWRASRLHSEDMGRQNYFSHTGKDGRSPWDRAKAQGTTANAENIAAGKSTASAVLTQWQNSDGHCKNMMNVNMKTFAVGYGYSGSSSYKHYWTQMLSTRSSADTSCVRGRSLSFVEEEEENVALIDAWEFDEIDA